MKKVIISVLGRDRPGIIATVSKNLFLKNCNIENVSQTSLQSEFAGIFIVSKPEKLSTDELQNHLDKALPPMDLYVHVKELDHKAEKTAAIRTEPFVISCKGPDRKGLVAEITEVIARYNVNIRNMQAVFKGGEDPKDNIMIYEVDIPTDTDRSALHQDLRETVQKLGLDINIQHRNIFETINRI
jgi:glycine cleavage system transcriptional repressor